MAIGMIPAAATPAGSPAPPPAVPFDAPAAARQESPALRLPVAQEAHPATEDDQAIQEAVDTINDALAKPPLEAQYSVNENAGLTIIKIVNTDSGEVLRQIPSEKAVILAEAIKARLTEKLHLVDEKA